MEVVLEAKDANDWIYRGEGAFNLVLAYSGSSPTFVGKVLRVQKAKKNGIKSKEPPVVLTKHEFLVWNENEDLLLAPTREIVEQLYAQHVITPLLGSEHIDAGLRVIVTSEFLESVENKVLSERPSSRIEAAGVNDQCDTALLISDHSIFPRGVLKEEFCISVEIKPKWGFLPSSRYITEENSAKRIVSRFRMHQALKLHQGQISEISKYDPLDLFSGSMDRVRKSIKDLFSTPQNNFRVFLNGSQVFGGSGGSADATNGLISEAFENVLKGVILASNGMRTTNFLQLVSDAISQSGLLERLLEAQKLDVFDIEGAIHAYYNVVSLPCAVCKELAKKNLSDRYTSLHSIPFDESLKIVRDYLIAATAKDLSLMISFRPRENRDEESPNSVFFLESTNQSFDYKVAFIDLDMKPLEKMMYYYKLDQQIVSYYMQTMKATHHPGNAVNHVETLYRDQPSAIEDASHTRDSAEEIYPGNIQQGWNEWKLEIFYVAIMLTNNRGLCCTKFMSGHLNNHRMESGLTCSCISQGLSLCVCMYVYAYAYVYVCMFMCVCGSFFITEFYLHSNLWAPRTDMKEMLIYKSQKTVVSVDLLCSKCRKKVMKLISSIEGVNSIVLDPSKNTATIIGEADPVRIIKNVRKFRSSAHIVSIGPPKDDKKDADKKDTNTIMPALPRTCQKCDVWYVVDQDYYTPCHIL